MRLLAALALSCAILFVANMLLQRLVAAVLVVMLLALTGCTFTVPTQPDLAHDDIMDASSDAFNTLVRIGLADKVGSQQG